MSLKCRIDTLEWWPVYEVRSDPKGDFDICDEKIERWEKALAAFDRAQEQMRALLEERYPPEPEKPLPERQPARQVIDYAGPGNGHQAAALMAKWAEPAKGD
jgi:hypothetical protein